MACFLHDLGNDSLSTGFHSVSLAEVRQAPIPSPERHPLRDARTHGGCPLHSPIDLCGHEVTPLTRSLLLDPRRRAIYSGRDHLYATYPGETGPSQVRHLCKQILTLITPL